VLLKAPAKINLTLRIQKKRADGFHEISSLMRAVRLFDEVRIELRPGGSDGVRQSHIRVRSDMPGVPEGSENLAYRAAEAALGIYPGRLHDIDITLKKQIPAAAGLAGGSADAAAVLLGIAKELKPEAKISDVAAWGAGLGKDIPFCVYACAAANPELGYKGAGAALAEGAGERLTPLEAQEEARVILVKPPLEIPTKQVYGLYDAWEGGASGSDNDLEAPCAEAWPIVSGLLGTLKKICADEGAFGAKVQLSGSGPTVFAYLTGPCENAAGRIYIRAKDVFKNMFVHMTKTL